ncbi:hypothetical protein V9T40_002192 [Parthenolecanium corni]|uniref:Uncharacterized protein n=1 Tax=Parthenolecanium corni TaxID=536013 RepID=A0AAN9TK37_9HEMI
MDFAKHIKPLSGESDWPIWKRKIRDLLDYQEGAVDIIEGTLTKPDPLEDKPTKEEQKEYKAASELYRKANSFAKSLISCAVSDSVYQKIMDKVSAYEAWEALKQQFEATSKDQLFKVCADFFAFNWTSGEDVSTHVAKLRSLWNELNNGLKAKKENQLPDLILMCKALHILPSSFESFKASWMLLTKDETKTFDELAMQLCVFERNMKQPIKSDDGDQEALFTRSKGSFNNMKSKDNRRVFSKEDVCNYCHQKGHWVSRCPKWFADGCPARDKAGNGGQNSRFEGAEATIAL